MTHDEVIRVLAGAVITLHRRLEAAEAAVMARAVSMTAEQIARDIARDWMHDPQFKREIQAVVRKYAAEVKSVQP